jgi:hypothetical protein
MSFPPFLFFLKNRAGTHTTESQKKWVVLWQDRAHLSKPKLALAKILISPPLNADKYIAKIVEIMGGYLNPLTIMSLLLATLKHHKCPG